MGDNRQINVLARGAVRVAKGVTINMGDYESVRLDYAYETYVEDDENPVEAMERVEEFVTAVLRKEEKRVRKDKFGSTKGMLLKKRKGGD